MAKAYMVVLARCNDPARRPEFEEWYSFHHQPDVAETPHFISASRYRLAATQSGQDVPEYLALYELDTDDIPAVQAALGANMSGKRAAGRNTRHETIDVVSVSYYTFVSQVMKAASVGAR